MTKDYFKVRVWAVIGGHNAGKSSVIGAMVSQPTGGPGGRRDVLLTGGGYLEIHAFRKSIQESLRSPNVAINKIVSAARKKQQKSIFSFYNVLIALRSDSYKTLPTAETYLEEFIKAGWIIESLVLLDIPKEYHRYVKFGAPTCEIEHSTHLTAESRSRNWIFGQARNHFGWA